MVDHKDKCQVLDELITLRNGNRSEVKLAEKMMYVLEQRVPGNPQGPMGMNSEASKHLSGHVYEFRRGQNFGPKIRVLYFYGDGKSVICTHCFLKRDRTPQEKISQAESLRDSFLEDLGSGNIQVLGES